MTVAVQTSVGTPSTDSPPTGDSTSAFNAATGIEQKPVVLTIATCSLGKVRIEWATNMFKLRKLIGMAVQQKVMLGYDLCDARNIAIHEAVRDGAEYLLFWDDDMLPHEGIASVKLMAELQLHPEIDVIGGVYPPRRDIPEPLVVKEKNQGTWWGWRDGKVHKVFMVGTGFMMIRLSSLDRINVPTKTIGSMEVREFFVDSQEFTDDFYFANLCADHGLNIYAHGDVICSQIDIDGNLFVVPSPDEMTELHNLYRKCSPRGESDKGTYHSYISFYAKELKRDASVLEVGVTHASMKLWREWFTGDVVGVDIGKREAPEGVTFIQTDATKPFDLGGKTFDYIIDDGSHTVEDQVASFNLLYPHLKEGGRYFIEDIQDVAACEKAFPQGIVHDLRHERQAPDNVIIEIVK